MLKKILAIIGAVTVVAFLAIGGFMLWGVEAMSQGVAGKHFWE